MAQFSETGAANVGDPADAAVTNPASSATVIAALKGLLAQLQGGGSGSSAVTIADGADVALGAVADAVAAAGDAGTVSAKLRRLTAQLSGGLPAALSAGGGVKVGVVDALPAGTALLGKVHVQNVTEGDYETVAASQTDQALGATGAAGDYLAGVLIVPATTSPGAVSIKDGAGGAITVFTGGASSVSNLVPFFVPLGIVSAAGAWKVSTGANVSAIAAGNFT